MHLAEAKTIAQDLVDRMRPCCDRIEIAGSIRRMAHTVKDIEIVAIPKWEERPVPFTDLFGKTPEPARINRLHEWANWQADIRWIKPGTPDIADWSPKPDGKYWRGLLPEGVKLDLFLTTCDQWGLLFLIRTGSAEFTAAVVKHGWRVGKRSRGGYLRAGVTEDSPIIPTPEEQDVFDQIGLVWVDPTERIGPGALRLKPLIR